MHHNRVIVVLTVLLVITGLLVWFLQGSKKDDFDSVSDYEKARTAGTSPVDAPLLPACARDIALVKKSDTAVASLTFTCLDTKERDAFVAKIKNGFEWNIFLLSDNQVKLERVTAQ